MTILNTVYQHIVTECKSCVTLFSESDPDKIRLGTIQVYSERDNLKFVASTSDFPCMEIRQISLAEGTVHSGGATYKSSWQVTLATGVFDYESRLFPKELAMMAIASRLKKWRYADDEAAVIGASVSPITIGRLSREGEPDSVKGWVMQFTYDCMISIPISILESYMTGA